MGLTANQLDEFSRSRVYPDGSGVRVSLRRTDSDAYPSGWKYTFHYGALDPESPGTLPDGTIRRYDNSHEATKGHELHVAPEREPIHIEFSGILELWERFWGEIPKSTFDLPGEE